MEKSLMPILSGPDRPTRFGNAKISDVIAQTLGRSSSRVAVRTVGNTSISYRELSRIAEDIGGRLSTLGVKAGDAVVVKLPRSIECVASILATQMMGAAFMSMDPSESNQRVQHACESTNAKAIISQSRDESINIDRLEMYGTADAPFSNIAYIMHTSGSTGIPKGVPVSQSALLNLVDWYIDMIAFSESASISHLSRPSFDFSIPELFVPFLTGGAMVLPKTQMGTQIVQTIEFLAQSDTKIIQLVPTLLRRFLGTLERLPTLARRFKQLNYVVCNGEVLPDILRQRFYATLPNVTLINSYGPTECCVAVTYHYCRPEDGDRPMLIGGPAPNVDVFVLDEKQDEVGFGVEGELWLGGVQTASGYVANPIESESRFVEFTTHRGRQILYRTGDYGVARSEAGLQFLGRKDGQIKYRGVRLEKGEITNAVERIGLCVDSAVILIDGEGDSDQHLVCLVTPEYADVDELSRRLVQVLPGDRVPRLFVALAELPYTRNGKLNESALARAAREALSAAGSRSQEPVETRISSYLECLLRAVCVVTRRVVEPTSVIRECAIDSLTFLEIQLELAGSGLMFSRDVYDDQDASLEQWATYLQRIECGTTGPAETPGTSVPVVRVADATQRFRSELSEVVDYIEAHAPKTITVHSSLIALKNVAPERIGPILLEAIERLSASVTVLLPAFTLSYCDTHYYHWKESSSETGVLGHLVLRELSAWRTKHPAYSMIVVGPKAAELSEEEWWRYSPFGDDSIFGMISQLGGSVMCLGTSVASHVHRCEFLAHVPYMKTIDVEGVVDFGAGPLNASSSIYVRDVVGRPEHRFLPRNVGRDVHELKDVMRDFALGGTYAKLVSVRDMESILVPAMRNEPYGFLREQCRDEARRAYPMKKSPGELSTHVNSSNLEAAK
ncbi:AMP-binding protein [Mesorhizobium sp. M0815]|uniref:AMP-binding protein n=1 Tax=Mesorhizobium sp. M0815 TaxID=2957005 RepID=UPI003338EECB